MSAIQQRVLEELGRGPAIEQQQIQGGFTSVVMRLTFSDGSSLIYKESSRAQPGMYACEADGLQSLDVPGGPRVPHVLSVAEDHLLLEDLGPQDRAPDGYWVEFGRSLARLHSHTNPQFGFHQDNYLGTMLLSNKWSDNGYSFFAETRLLNFLNEPKADAVLTPEDRCAVERLASKLPEIVPPQPPSLVHGDLWTGNMLVGPGGQPALIDPAVYYGWAEADLALLPMSEAIPADFFDAYQEIRPLEPGWRQRLQLLAVRDPLCMIAEYGDVYGGLDRIRAGLKPMY